MRFGDLRRCCFYAVIMFATLDAGVFVFAETPDVFEPDDRFEAAARLTVNDPLPHAHTFHRSTDTDWIRFFAASGAIYRIIVSGVGSECDPALALYDETGRPREDADVRAFGGEEHLQFHCPATGVYGLQISPAGWIEGAISTGYAVSVIQDNLPDFPGTVAGSVTDAQTGRPIAGAAVTTNGPAAAETLENGAFLLLGHPSGTYTLTVEAPGYQPTALSITVSPLATTEIDVALHPDLPDQVLTLEIEGSGFVEILTTNGRCSAECRLTFPAGEPLWVEARPAPGWRFSHWTEICHENPCRIRMTENRRITAVFEPVRYPVYIQVEGSGEVETGTGEMCRDACEILIPAGEVIDLQARPEVGWVFTGWTGACEGNGPCAPVVESETPVTAVFTRRFFLSVETQGEGRIRTESGEICRLCSIPAVSKATVVLFPVPDSGWAFARWEGVCRNAETPCRWTAVSNDTLTAVFRPIPTPPPVHTLAVTVRGGGRVREENEGRVCTGECRWPVSAGVEVILKALPDPGWTFAGFGDDITANPKSLYMDEDIALTAVFKEEAEDTPVMLSVIVSGGGKVTVNTEAGGAFSCRADCRYPAAPAATILLTAVPDAGAAFMEWSGACGGTATTCRLTMDGARSVGADFDAQGEDAGGGCFLQAAGADL
jgi:hypothetical protein